jgi:hypothetical protein
MHLWLGEREVPLVYGIESAKYHAHLYYTSLLKLQPFSLSLSLCSLYGNSCQSVKLVNAFTA